MQKGRHKKLATLLLRTKSQVILAFIIGLLLISFALFSQSQSLTYKVMRNGNETGWIKLNKNVDGNTSAISMSSEVKVRLVFLFIITNTEYAELRNEKLVYSHVLRKVNTSIKADVYTRWTGSSYEKGSATQQEKLSFQPVSLTVLDLYFREPVGIDEVYSGTHQQNLATEKKQAGVYRTILPDGKFKK